MSNKCEGLLASRAMEGTRHAHFQLRGQLESSEEEPGNKSDWSLLPGLLDRLTCNRPTVKRTPSQLIVNLCRIIDIERAYITPHITKNSPAEEHCTEITGTPVMRPPSEINAGVWL